MERNEYVYLVVQHQSTSPEYDNRTVYVCNTRELAEYAAAKLNKEYAENVELDEDNLFIDIKDDMLEWHYYTVDSCAVEKTKEDIDEYGI